MPLLRSPSNEGRDDVVGVPVQVAAGPVVPGGHAGVGVTGGDLHVPQRDAGIQACDVPGRIGTRNNEGIPGTYERVTPGPCLRRTTHGKLSRCTV